MQPFTRLYMNCLVTIHSLLTHKQSFFLCLFSVSENLDDVLHIVSDKTKKTATKKQPTSSQTTAMKSRGGLFDDEDEGSNIPDMGNDDIMKYIEQNQSTTDDDLELF